MKILVATTAPTYWGPQARCIADVLSRRGHEASAVGPLPARARLDCDVLFCIGSGESVLPFVEAAPDAAKVLYLIEAIPTPQESDDFTRLKLEIHRGAFSAFDVVLVHTERSLPLLRELGVPRVRPTVWPHFPSIYSQRAVEKDVDVLFVGAPSEHRSEVLKVASRNNRVLAVHDAFHADAAALYARAKVALNVHFSPLRNFECRVVEALGCGAFLLTEALDPPGLLLDGVHLATFTPETLPERLDHYLADDAARERIARAGHSRIQRYCVEARAADLEAAALEALSVRRATKRPADPPPTSSSRRSRVNVGGRDYDVVHPAGSAFIPLLEEVFLHGAYPALPFLKAEEGTILDVGANVGLACVWFRALYPKATVFAVEPGREAFAYLQANAQALGDVKTFNVALLDCDGTAGLFRGTHVSATASLFRGAQTARESEDVVVRRASSFVAEQGIGRVLLLKIDTEGSEVPILRDLVDVLQRTDAVQLEYHAEADRLAIDGLLCGRFVLSHAKAEQPHRGTLTYVSKALLDERTGAGAWEIRRPEG